MSPGISGQNKSIQGRFLNNETIAALDAATITTASTFASSSSLTSGSSITSSSLTSNTAMTSAISTTTDSGSHGATSSTVSLDSTLSSGTTAVTVGFTSQPGSTTTTSILTQTLSTIATGSSTTDNFQQSSSQNKFPDYMIAGISGGVGGALLLTLCSVFAYKCAKKKNKDSSGSSISLTEMKPLVPQNPFAASNIGFTNHPTVIGAIHNVTYAIWKELSVEEAELVRPLTAKHIPTSQGIVKFNLGIGNFGATYVGRGIEDTNFYAIKEVNGRKAVDESFQEGEILNELKDGPNVMKLIDYRHYAPLTDAEEPRLFQIMPLAYINGKGYKDFLISLTPNQLYARVADSFQQIMKGLSFMHNFGIIHLDIKDENILYKQDGTLLISDLGRARNIQNDDKISSGNLGDRRKYAPEQVAFIRYISQDQDRIQGEKVASFSGKAADVWSAGLFILELLVNNDPFSEEIGSWHEKIYEWRNASYQTELDKINLLKDPSLNYRNVLRKALRVDPRKRMTSERAFEHLKKMNLLSQPNQNFAQEIANYQNAQLNNNNSIIEQNLIRNHQDDHIHYNFYGISNARIN